MFAKNIRYLRKSRKWTQSDLAQKLGYSTFTTVNKWETGVNKAPYAKLTKIAQLFNVTEDELMNVDLEKRDLEKREGKIEPKGTSVRINVYRKIHAGVPDEATDDIVDWEDIPREWTTGGREYFGLKVKGDCMMPKYQDGDTIIVRKCPDCESGQDCIVQVGDEGFELKKVIKKMDCIVLQPLNPAYEPRVYDYEDEFFPITIAGVVVEIRRKV